MNRIQKKIALLYWLCAVSCIGTMAQSPGKVSAYVGVHIVPMDREHIIENQTVLIRDGKILEIGDVNSVKIPEEATVVDLKGMFMMPGLADMQATLPEGAPIQIGRDDYLKMNIIRGVTTLRSMHGNHSQLAWRDSIDLHLLLGPHLFLTSPALPSELNYKQGCALLEQYKKEKYDFVKYEYPLRASLYDSLLAFAVQINMKIAGNVPAGGIAAAAMNKQASLEHLEPFLEEYKQDTARFLENIQALAAAGVYVCPDFQWYYVNWEQLWPAQLKVKPGMNMLPHQVVSAWIGSYQKEYAEAAGKDKPSYLRKKNERGRELMVGMKLLKMMEEEGVPLMVSAGEGAFIVPGFSMLDECRNFNDAGITPYQTLRAATVNAASFFGQSSVWGTVSKGKRADLLILEENPLLSIESLDKIKGVVLNGTWYPKEELERIQAEIIAKNQPGK